jgi:hypothetical protein
MERVNISVDIVLKCDKCGGTIRNHYPINEIDINILSEIEKLADLNDCDYENLDCSDGKLLCYKCNDLQ